jgi:hypothetical protein
VKYLILYKKGVGEIKKMQGTLSVWLAKRGLFLRILLLLSDFATPDRKIPILFSFVFFAIFNQKLSDRFNEAAKEIKP